MFKENVLCVNPRGSRPPKGDPGSGTPNTDTSEPRGLRLNIRVKLAVILLISGLTPLGALSYSLNQKIKTKLLDINKNQLIALREEKKTPNRKLFQTNREPNNYFFERSHDRGCDERV